MPKMYQIEFKSQFQWKNLTLVKIEGNKSHFIPGSIGSITFNQEMSEALLLKSGTRQECPLR